MVIKYHVSPYPTLLENMVAKIWEAQSDGPGAEVFTEVIPERNAGGVPTPGAGHQVPYTVIANGMDKVAHIVRLYSAVSNQLLHWWNVEALTEIVTVFEPIQFKIGDGNPLTPAANSNVYANPILNGLGDNEYLVFRNNYGYLFPNLHYYNNVVGGGFTLDGADVFWDQEEFTIQMRPKAVVSPVNDSVVGKWFAGYVDVAETTSVDFVPAHLRKLIRMTGVCSYNFNVHPPDGYAFCFQAFNGPGSGAVAVCTIFFNNAPVRYNGADYPAITIRDNQSAAFVFDVAGGFWNIIYLVDSKWYEALGAGPGVYTPLSIIQAGRTEINTGGGYPIGDLPPGDILIEVLHGMAIVGDYIVQYSLEVDAVANTGASNKVTHAWCHNLANKPNSFYITLQELTNEVQHINISWIIIKLP
jgi:hypothetical protein